jgi:hypothetical protein
MLYALQKRAREDIVNTCPRAPCIPNWGYSAPNNSFWSDLCVRGSPNWGVRGGEKMV